MTTNHGPMGSTQEVASRTKNIMRMNLHLEPISKSNGLKGFITCVAWLLVAACGLNKRAV